jgi:hypothetical protein
VGTVSPVRLHRFLAPLALGALLLAGCSSEEAVAPRPDETPGSPTSDASATGPSTPSAACAAVIPTSVVAGLGWSTDVAATEGLGGCAWQGEDGQIVVAAEGSGFEAVCGRLAATEPTSGHRASIDVPAGVPACAYVREGDLGLSRLVLAAEDGRVIGIRVAPRTATTPEQVRTALLDLSEPALAVS